MFSKTTAKIVSLLPSNTFKTLMSAFIEFSYDTECLYIFPLKL